MYYWNWNWFPLTSQQHGEDRENLLVVRHRRHVPKSDARQNSKRKVKRRDVTRPNVRRVARHVRQVVLLGEGLEPPGGHVRPRPLNVRDRVEEASQPVGDEGEGGHEEKEDASTVFGVLVDAAGYSEQP